MPLTDALIRQAKPTGKTKKFFDGSGLYLELTPNGAKYWRLKYRYANRENRISLGVYPTTTLAAARKARDAARALLANGTDPSQQRKVDKIANNLAHTNTFEGIAREWHTTKSSNWSDSHAATCMARMARDLFPWLGNRPLVELKPPEILAVLKRIESRGTLETAHRCKGIVSQVFDHAIATGRAECNPASALGAALQSKIGEHHSAIIAPERLGQMMRDIYGYAGTPITQTALKIHALTFQRPNEISGMAWAEINLDAALWTIPSERMKRIKKHKANGIPHLVPLSRQAVDILRDIQPITGSGPLVFPGERRGRSISENTARQALRSMGYTDHTPHGFRATARTLIPEQLNIDKVVVERAISHGTDEALGSAYDRTQYFERRVSMMQAWADYLDKLRNSKAAV